MPFLRAPASVLSSPERRPVSSGHKKHYRAAPSCAVAECPLTSFELVPNPDTLGTANFVAVLGPRGFTVGVGVAVGVAVAGGGVEVATVVGGTEVGAGVLVAAGVLVGNTGVAVGTVPLVTPVATKDVYVAETPRCTCMRNPIRPEEKLPSVAVTIQLAGSVALVGHTLAERVVPETWKRREYDVPPVAAKGAAPTTVVVPFTLFWTTRLVPSMYALYQLLPSVQRRTAPRLVYV